MNHTVDHMVLSNTERSVLFFSFSLNRVREAEERELSTLYSIVENAKQEKRNKMVIAGFGNEIERFILRRREEQHKKLLEVYSVFCLDIFSY